MTRRFLSVVSSAVLLATACGTVSAQSATRLPFTSNFETGNFSEWDAFRNTTGVTIETNGCQSGRCARGPFPAGTIIDNYGDFLFGDNRSVRGPKVEEVWLSLYSKFDPGIVWPSSSQKIAIFNLTDPSSGDRLYQAYVYVRSNGEYAVDKSNIATWQFFGYYQNANGAPVGVRLGQWDKLKLHVKLNTPGQSNGVIQLWVNNVLKIDYNNVNIRESTTYGVNKLIFGSYATRESPSAGVQWWDTIKVSATDPDGTTAVLPNPPTNVRVQ